MKPAPKDPLENARYRAALAAYAQDNYEFQHQCWMRAARDPVWWIDAYGWTFSPKEHPEFPDRPFILYA
jgi:hypothetical protein